MIRLTPDDSWQDKPVNKGFDRLRLRYSIFLFMDKCGWQATGLKGESKKIFMLIKKDQ